MGTGPEERSCYPLSVREDNVTATIGQQQQQQSCPLSISRSTDDHTSAARMHNVLIHPQVNLMLVDTLLKTQASGCTE